MHKPLLSYLAPAFQRYLEHAKDVAHTLDTALFLVGGSVRDALLAQKGHSPHNPPHSHDLDLMVPWHDALVMSKRLQKRLNTELTFHEAFGTYKLQTTEGLRIDISGMRSEQYPQAGALPKVLPGTLADDLKRRDYTVNAMTLQLTPHEHWHDPHSGRTDLQRGLLRSLHSHAFEDDPTRISRGARLAVRLGFRFEQATWAQIPHGLQATVLDRVSSSRLKHELALMWAEDDLGAVLVLLEACGALEALFLLTCQSAFYQKNQLDFLATMTALHQQQAPADSYLLAMLSALSAEQWRQHQARFGWGETIVRAWHLVQEAIQAQLLPPSALIKGLAHPLIGKPSVQHLLSVLSPTLAAQLQRLRSPANPRLSGQDVLELGSSSGEQVGQVLYDVAKAYATGQITTRQEALDLAAQLINPQQIHKEGR